MVSDSLPSFLGMVKFMFFTHNTMLSVLYTMVTSPDAHFIRCCSGENEIINRGAQFRHGLDSQYGDIIFEMKRDFWLDLKGIDYKKKAVIDHAFVGHFYQHDFIEYKNDDAKFEVDKWLEADSRMYNFRPPTEGLNGKECKKPTWEVSWCNVQIHIGENIKFSYVEKVYAPAWILHDSDTMARIEANGINTTLLTLLVSNRLPFYPHEDNIRNPLNGLFHLYGPAKANDHYHIIEKERGKFKERPHSHSIYQDIESSTDTPTIQTHRYSSSSSAMSLHQNAFEDLQVRYMADLIRANMTELSLSEYVTMKKHLVYPDIDL